VANAGVRGRPIAPLVLSAQERAYLERQVRRHRVARSLSERCRAILRCADGLPSKSVAAELGIHEHTVGKWRRRFLKDRCDGLLDEARPGRPRTINDDQVAAVIERTLRTTPADATHWSIRSMAAETGFSHTTIRRMWSAFGLQPHRSQTFKLSSDPLFVDKVRDIVGLYLSPPNRALVLSIDEKSQIQALDREQPVLPMMPGVPERRTHSYVRHGTTTLFAALDVASGFVIGKCYKRHRAVEFLKFLKEIDAQIPEGLAVHIVMDNYATHKRPRSKRGSLAGRTIMFTSRRLLRPGSTRSSAGSLNSPESKSSEVFTPPSSSSRPTSAPSSICTTKTRSPSNGLSLLTRFWLPSNASATKPTRLYVVNFRFT
jgi:transposase